MLERLKKLNISISKNTATTLIGLAVMLYLVPSLLARCQFNELEDQYEKDKQQQQSRIAQQQKNIANTLTSLNFKDSKLTQCLQNQLQQQSFNTNTVLTKFQLIKKVTHLNCQLMSIESIQGIQTLMYLQRIDLNYNKITDLSPIQELLYLTDLKLADNPVSSIKPLLSSPSIKSVALPDLKNINCTQLNSQLSKAKFRISNSNYKKIQCNNGTRQSPKYESTTLNELLKKQKKLSAKESLRVFGKQFKEDTDFETFKD
jgi:internalin A